MYISTTIENIYVASKKSKDKFILKECVLSKLGELLAKDKADLITYLRGRELTFTKTTDKFILDLLFEQMKRSDNVCGDVAKMILKKDGVTDDKIGTLKNVISPLLMEIARQGSTSKNIILEYREQIVYKDDDAKKLYADAHENETPEETSKKIAKRNKMLVIGGVILLTGIVYVGVRWYRKHQAMETLKELQDIEGDEKVKVDEIEKGNTEENQVTVKDKE